MIPPVGSPENVTPPPNERDEIWASFTAMLDLIPQLIVDPGSKSYSFDDVCERLVDMCEGEMNFLTVNQDNTLYTYTRRLQFSKTPQDKLIALGNIMHAISNYGPAQFRNNVGGLPEQVIGDASNGDLVSSLIAFCRCQVYFAKSIAPQNAFPDTTMVNGFNALETYQKSHPDAPINDPGLAQELNMFEGAVSQWYSNNYGFEPNG